MSADAHEDFREPRPGCLGEIDDLGHIRQVIARKRDDFGPPALQQAKIRAMVLDLQINELHLVPGPAQRLRDELEPERLEPQKDLCVHQRSRMDAEDPHDNPLQLIRLCPNPPNSEGFRGRSKIEYRWTGGAQRRRDAA